MSSPIVVNLNDSLFEVLDKLICHWVKRVLFYDIIAFFACENCECSVMQPCFKGITDSRFIDQFMVPGRFLKSAFKTP